MKRDSSESRFHQYGLGGVGTLIFLMSVGGCELERDQLVTVRGRVTRAGKPVENLFLNFVPDHGRPSWAITDANGEFVAFYDKERNGVKPGAHTIFVTFKRYDPRDSGRLLTEPPGLVTMLAKYGRPEVSPLRMVANSGDQIFDLRLD